MVFDKRVSIELMFASSTVGQIFAVLIAKPALTGQTKVDLCLQALGWAVRADSRLAPRDEVGTKQGTELPTCFPLCPLLSFRRSLYSALGPATSQSPA